MAEPVIDAAVPKSEVAPPPTAPKSEPEPEVKVAKAATSGLGAGMIAKTIEPEPAKPDAVLEEIKRERAELALELKQAREHNERTRNRALLSKLKDWGAIDIGDQNLLALTPKDIDPETPEGVAKLDKWAKGEGARLFAAKGPTQAETLEAAAKRLKPPETYKGPHDEKYAAQLLANVAARASRGGQ